MKRIISGASGFVGQLLVDAWRAQAVPVVPIQRVEHSEALREAVAWNVGTGWLDHAQLEGASVVVHLAGENVGSGRWTRRKKERIRGSRVDGTRQLVSALSRLKCPPSLFLCASATGFYGPSSEGSRNETHPSGEGFLASVCSAWETEAMRAAEAGIRTVLLRFGVILDPRKGALKKMLLPFRLGLGGCIGSGSQYMPWICSHEIPHAVEFLMQQQAISGPVNLVSPEPMTNQEFTRALARQLNRPALLPLPAFAVRLLFGEMGEETLLSSCRAEPMVLNDHAYPFRHPTLREALARLLSSLPT